MHTSRAASSLLDAHMAFTYTRCGVADDLQTGFRLQMLGTARECSEVKGCRNLKHKLCATVGEGGGGGIDA
jgi:hypothetical protein